MGTQTAGRPPSRHTSSSWRPPAASASLPAASAPTREVPDGLPPRRGRSNLSWVGTFVPVATAAVALAVHKGVHNRQNAMPTGVYARVLMGVMIAFTLLGLTQRFWRRMKPTRWNFPIAAFFNVLHWFVSSAPIVGV